MKGVLCSFSPSTEVIFVPLDFCYSGRLNEATRGAPRLGDTRGSVQVNPEYVSGSNYRLLDLVVIGF